MFSKILVANRGEIAVRVIRTCREMGISSVAVYSDADKESLHVRLANEAINIGPPLARKSYLSIENIIEAAKKTGAEAIHPGYGFLAENASFVEACDASDIKFIGPSAETQRLTGEKVASRKTAVRAGVPVHPGSEGAVSLEEAVEVAERVGYPVMIKAVFGGGGRGMRTAYSKDELRKLLPLAKGEAAAGFGNSDVFIERYIEEPHHIEFQILADEFGNCMHLGERECSIQRRYQKLIEESPSPFLTPELREKMGKASVTMARSVGYVSAGTVEFLVAPDGNFYFNEVNSRLQVEHPVTEMVAGIDLVRQQIIIAAGGRIKLRQEEVEQRGWSIECRINAEDPENDFATRPGIITEVILPGGPGVRVDTHIYPGCEISPFYDSLLAKVIVWAEERRMAIHRMDRALSEFQIEGIRTTIPFHQKVMHDEDFINGDFSTHFLTNLISRNQAGLSKHKNWIKEGV